MTILALNELSRAERHRLGLPADIDLLSREQAERLEPARVRSLLLTQESECAEVRCVVGRPLTSMG